MEQRITSLLLPAPEAELEASCKELDEKLGKGGFSDDACGYGLSLQRSGMTLAACHA